MTNDYIIFDMDGVLLDSEPMHQEIIYETFQLKGIPFDNPHGDVGFSNVGKGKTRCPANRKCRGANAVSP